MPPPPTLEQVLARSMRLSRPLAQRQLAALFALDRDSTVMTTRAAAAAATTDADGRRCSPAATAHRRNFFDALAAQEAAERAGRLRIRASPQLVGNGADLLSYLTGAQRMGAWQEGLDAFLAAIGMRDAAALEHAFCRACSNHDADSTADVATAAAATATQRDSGNDKANRVADDASMATSTPPSDVAGECASLVATTPTAHSAVDVDWVRAGVTATHAMRVIDLCASAGRWRCVQCLTWLCGSRWPEVLTHGATRLVQGAVVDEDSHNDNNDNNDNDDKSSSASRVDDKAPHDADAERAHVCGWQHTLHFLTQCVHAGVAVPVDAYHACLRGCEAACDWHGALCVLRAMGPSPLRDAATWPTCSTHDAVRVPRRPAHVDAPATPVDDAGERESDTAPTTATTSTSADSDAPPPSSSSASLAPEPNVVTYAILLATLEQAGQDDLVRQVLQRLPPVERDAISSSYAALIMVWSSQSSRTRRVGYSRFGQSAHDKATELCGTCTLRDAHATMQRTLFDYVKNKAAAAAATGAAAHTTAAAADAVTGDAAQRATVGCKRPRRARSRDTTPTPHDKTPLDSSVEANTATHVCNVDDDRNDMATEVQASRRATAAAAADGTTHALSATDAPALASSSSSSSSSKWLASLLTSASWRQFLAPLMADTWQHGLFLRIERFLDEQQAQGKVVYPPRQRIFSAFNSTPFDQLKVVLLGQDPYHNYNQAHGLSFSVLPGVTPPPSLQNMYKELAHDIDGFVAPRHGYLQSWAEQGMLMLNASLTVEAGKANSHSKCGWQTFTDDVIRRLSAQHHNRLVFLLWGNFARKKKTLIDSSRHVIIESAHPSPLSATLWWNCRCFSKCNAALEQLGHTPMTWQLPMTAVIDDATTSSEVNTNMHT